MLRRHRCRIGGCTNLRGLALFGYVDRVKISSRDRVDAGMWKRDVCTRSSVSGPFQSLSIGIGIGGAMDTSKMTVVSRRLFLAGVSSLLATSLPHSSA